MSKDTKVRDEEAERRVAKIEGTESSDKGGLDEQKGQGCAGGIKAETVEWGRKPTNGQGTGRKKAGGEETRTKENAADKSAQKWRKEWGRESVVDREEYWRMEREGGGAV